MTYQEILDDVTAYQDNKLDDMRFKAIMSYQVGVLVANGVSMAFGGGKHFPQIHEIYPTLFEKPELQSNNEIMKERLLEYAEYWNDKISKKGDIE